MGLSRYGFGMLINRLAEIRRARGLSQKQLAELIGTEVTQLGKLERGERRMSDVWLRRLSEALHVDPGDLVSERPITQKIAVAGYVGAGAEVIPFDDFAKGAGLFNVEVPAGLGAVVAVIVRGDSMWPRYQDGDVVLYRRQDDNPSELIGKECVVNLSDGRMFLKTLAKGNTLLSHNASPIEDVTIEWAAPVRWVVRGGASVG